MAYLPAFTSTQFQNDPRLMRRLMVPPSPVEAAPDTSAEEPSVESPAAEVQPAESPIPSELPADYGKDESLPLNARKPAFQSPTFDQAPVHQPTRSEQLQSQLTAMDQPPSTKSRLLSAIFSTAPALIAAATGGEGGLALGAGLAEGANQRGQQDRTLQQQQRASLTKQIEDELQRDERMKERQLTTEATTRGQDLKQKEIDEQIAGRRQTADIAAGARKDAAATNETGRLAAVAGKTVDVVGADGKPHRMQLNPKTLKYDIDAGVSYEKPVKSSLEEDIAASYIRDHPATNGHPTTLSDFNEYNKKLVPQTNFNLNAGKTSDARMDKSYQFNSGQLDKSEKPIADQIGRFSRLQDTMNQMTPQADALIAPELLSVMAGGQGSGLRMNEAEISRVVGGRSNWESLKASLNKWQIDPSKALSVTPAQRQQMRDLMKTVYGKLTTKQQILDDARQQLIDAETVPAHRQILADTQKKLTAIDAGSADQSSVGKQISVIAPDGKRGSIPFEDWPTAQKQGYKRAQ